MNDFRKILEGNNYNMIIFEKLDLTKYEKLILKMIGDTPEYCNRFLNFDTPSGLVHCEVQLRIIDIIPVRPLKPCASFDLIKVNAIECFDVEKYYSDYKNKPSLKDATPLSIHQLPARVSKHYFFSYEDFIRNVRRFKLNRIL